jgi:hypothetical protein
MFSHQFLEEDNRLAQYSRNSGKQRSRKAEKQEYSRIGVSKRILDSCSNQWMVGQVG